MIQWMLLSNPIQSSKSYNFITGWGDIVMTVKKSKKLLYGISLFLLSGLVMLLAGCGGGGGGVAATTPGEGTVAGYMNALVAKTAARSADSVPAGYAPVENATVVCAGKSDTTDADGYYEIKEVPSGTQTCTATKENLTEITFSVVVVANETVVATAQDSTDTAFEPEVTGALSVSSTPTGASISIDGTTIEDTTDATLLLVPGTYSVVLSLTGYETSQAKSVTITQNATATAAFGALSPMITQIVVSPDSYAFTTVSATRQLAASCTYIDSTSGDCTSDVTWTSSDEQAATVSASGLVTSVGAGSATITASNSDGSASDTIIVSVTDTFTSITVTPSSIDDLIEGTTQTLSASCVWSISGSASCASLTWSSDDGNVVTVDAQGVVSGVGAGSATVKASSDGVESDAVSVTVIEDTLQTLSVSPSTIDSLLIGATSNLSIVCLWTSSGLAECPALTWSSGDDDIATVSASGVVTGIAVGNTNVTASANGIDSNSVAVTVVDVGTLENISVTPASITNLGINETSALSAACTFVGTGSGQCPTLTWTSADISVATVDPSGVVTGVAAGDTTVKAASGDVDSNNISVNVNTPPAASITSPADGASYAQTVDISFSGTGTDAEDTSGALTYNWTSDIDGEIAQTSDFTKYDLSAGTHTITFSVTDTGNLAASTSTTLIVTQNNAPTAQIVLPADNSTYNATTDILFTGAATDPDTGTNYLTYAWVSNIDGSLSSDAIFQTSDLSIGTHTITFSATDRGSLTDQKSITVVIEQNTEPVAGIASPTTGSSFGETASITFIGSATDAEDNQSELTYSWTSDIDGEIATDLVAVVDTLSQGDHLITFTITDTGNLTDYATITITIGANTAPTAVITSPAEGASYNQTQTITFNGLNSTDAEENALELGYLWVSNADGVIGTTGTFTLDDLSVGDHTILLTVKDSGNLADSTTVSISIGANTAPEVTISSPTDGASYNQTDNITFQCTVVDAEETIMTTYAWSSSIDGSFGGNSPLVQVSTLSTGTHTITVSVTDSGGLSDNDSIELVINANTAPTASITSPADGASYTGADYITFQGSASDAEDDALGLSYEWSSSIDGVFSTLIIAPLVNTLSAGTHTITFKVTDSGALTADDSITLHIAD